jgi:hypothetical protein
VLDDTHDAGADATSRGQIRELFAHAATFWPHP